MSRVSPYPMHVLRAMCSIRPLRPLRPIRPVHLIRPPFNPSVLYIFSDSFIPFRLICPMSPFQPLRLIHFLRLVHSFPSHLSHVPPSTPPSYTFSPTCSFLSVSSVACVLCVLCVPYVPFVP